MRLINKKDIEKGQKELEDNINSLEMLLDKGGGEDFDLAVDLVRRGMNFVVYKVRNKLHFAPSRFLGYFDNTPSKQQRNPIKDGKDTSPIISKIICGKYGQWEESEPLTELHGRYCNSFGVVSCRSKKRFIFLDEKAKKFYNTTNSD